MPRQFDMMEWLKRSTAASGVPLRVEDQAVIRQMVVQLRLARQAKLTGFT